MKDFVNWAILAPGIIANSMAEAITGTAKKDKRIQPYAVASRDLERSKDFAEKWGFKKAYGSYDELFDDPNVDVIYVANPHAFHFDSVMKALDHGKHVLCEKPAGVNMSQLTQMIKKAEVKELFFMEAMWTAFNPCVNKVVDEINKGSLGKVKHIESRFCNRLPYDPKSRMFAPELAGGALLDLGIYNIYFSMIMAQSTKIDTYNSSVRLYKGVDVWNSVNLSFDNGITASFQSACDMSAASDTHNATIFCENGYITLHNFFMAQKARVHMFTKEWGNTNVVSKVIRAPFGINGYEYEMIETTNCILEGKLQSEKFKHEDSIKLCQIMDRLREDWKMKYPFE